MASLHDQFAKEYDEQIEKYDCRLAEVVFGLCYGDITKGESVLDVGIGTGLSSRLFHQAGLRIFGIDGSDEMLSICQDKHLAVELVHQDILEFPWPYPNDSFEHLISCGVFHFIGDLEGVFAEMRRVQKEDGLLAFTVMKSDPEQAETRHFIRNMVDGIPVYSHSMNYIQGLLDHYHYEKEKEITCLVGETPFRVIRSRKTSLSHETL